MLRQHDAEQLTDRTDAPVRRSMSGWLRAALERVVGECWPGPKTAVLVLFVIAGLLAVIALTLSIGNALLVALVAVVMRVACEWRPAARR